MYFDCFYYMVDHIHAALVSIRDFFQKPTDTKTKINKHYYIFQKELLSFNHISV